MKIFLDTANINAIKKWKETGLVDGVTTNPTHLAIEGNNPRKQVIEICKLLPKGEISVEVTKIKPVDVYKQAKEIAALSKNILVKIPCHANYYPVIKKLVNEKVKLNITLVFSLAQSLFMSKLGVTYISPFIGRWDDIDVDGTELLIKLRVMQEEYNFKTGILAASLRTVRNFHDAIMAGCDVATLPISIMQKAMAHPLTDQGIEKFNADWAQLGIKKFP